MGKAIIGVLLAFAVTLAAVVGSRMSTEAMAVVVGVVCGVVAGIPMSVLILLILNRRDRAVEESACERLGARRGYPPVVVIQGGSPASEHLMPPFYTSQAMTYEPTERQFRVVGQQGD